MKLIKTLLADDHTVVREGLRALLLADGGIDVVGQAHNGREAVELVAKHHPDVAVHEVMAGNSFYSPQISKRLRDHYQKPDRIGGLMIKKATGLTSRELEVIQLVAEGHANKQVAAGLNISIKTVEKHRQHLMDKLNIHDTAGLTRYAIAQGIIESSVQVTIV